MYMHTTLLSFQLKFLQQYFSIPVPCNITQYYMVWVLLHSTGVIAQYRCYCTVQVLLHSTGVIAQYRCYCTVQVLLHSTESLNEHGSAVIGGYIFR